MARARTARHAPGVTGSSPPAAAGSSERRRPPGTKETTKEEVGYVTVERTSSRPVSKEASQPSWPAPPNPGDLSRRLATRRAELRLSIPQVAQRAGIRIRYLEFLERYPSHPAPATLRQLAAALQTTPTALLGADDSLSTGHGGVPVPGKLEPLGPGECTQLLEPGGIGRLAFLGASGIIVLPVNYAVIAGGIVVRTEEGSSIAAHGDDPVSFEADHVDEVLGQGWSVLVRGHAHRVLQPCELELLRKENQPRPWPAGEHDLFIKIVPDRITGRRIRTQ